MKDLRERWLEKGIYGSNIDSSIKDKDVDAIAYAAGEWAAKEWLRRTSLLEEGKGDINWGDPDSRVCWSDVLAQLKEIGVMERRDIIICSKPLGGVLREKIQLVFDKKKRIGVKDE